MEIKALLAVFVGGGLGSLMRYAAQAGMHRMAIPYIFPWATMGVNVAGSFLIGLFYACSARMGFPLELRLFLATGLCGGFTTFSTFSHECLAMLRDGHFVAFLLYAIGCVAVGVLAVAAGSWAGAAWMRG